MKITFTVTNSNPQTLWNRLALQTPEAQTLLSEIRAICPNAYEAATDGSVTTIAELRESLDYIKSLN